MRHPLGKRGDLKRGIPWRQRQHGLAAVVLVSLCVSAAGIDAADAAGGARVLRELAPADSSSPLAPFLLLVQGQRQATLNVSKVILAEPAGETPLPIQVGPVDAIARNSFIRIRGLPPSAALTEGHSIAPGAWAIPIIALPNLKITLPVGLSGKSEVTVALVTVDGTVVSETKTALVIASTALIAPGDAEPQSKSVASLGPSSAAVRSSEPATRPQTSQTPAMTDEQKRALPFIGRGNEQLAQGNIAAARLFYQRAAEAGLAQGALALAATYDPAELERIGARYVQPDTQIARKWYERARQLGALEAEDRLKQLGSR
ncbi:MAG: hypothetical protein ACKVP3_06080 [Hyphomicrobiaceae bacterium]